MFNPKWFIKHQKILLWVANTLIGRYILCINGNRSSVGKYKITKILPNALFWTAGRYKKAEFRTHNKFSKRLFYVFYPIWWLIHQWDMLFANNFQPAWNLGFDTLTVYPDANVESTSVDGYIKIDAQATWAGVHDATSASGGARPNAALDQFARASIIGGTYYISRGFFLFDTSALPTGPNISSAVLSIYDSNNDTRNADTTAVHIVASTPASNTDLVDEDFDQVGSTSFASIALSSWVNTGAYNAFTLNASGISAISDSGISKYGARIARDLDNSAPTGDNLTQCNFADQTGTTSDPKLVVTYTEASLTSGTNSRISLLGVGL